MPTHSFSSFEAYVDATRHADVRAMVLGPVRTKWVLSHLMLNRLSLQWGGAGSKVTADGSPKPGGLTILFSTQIPSSMWANGQLLDESTLLTMAPGDNFSLAADVSRRWCSLFMPYEELGRAHAEWASVHMIKRGVSHLPGGRVQRLRSVIAQIDEIHQHAPTAFDSAAAQIAAEQKMLREIRSVLWMPHQAEPTPGRPILPREEIIRRSMDFVDQHDGEYLAVEQLAAAANVSERTLRTAFQQYFGEPPARYLKLRTLHQVRRALREADPSARTVTDIAAQFGVWELSRMARDYRHLFGELPSATLRH